MFPHPRATLDACCLLILTATISLAASSVEEKREQIHTGRIVSVTTETLVMTDEEGNNQQSFLLIDAVAVTIDGERASVPDLKKGDAVRVAVGQDAKVTRIEAERKDAK